MSVDADAEIRSLRSVLRDMVALSSIPAAWVGLEPAAVAAALAEALTGLLQLDFVYVRLCIPGVADAVAVTRGQGWETFPAWLEGHLARCGRLSGKQIVPDIDGVPGGRCGIVIPIGVDAEGGMVAATSERADFPAEADQLLLNLAANHAATEFQNERLNERQGQMRSLESLDKIDRAIQGTSDLDQMLGDVLDTVLVTFGCDRAFLIHPCDPDAFRPGEPDVPSRVHVERSRPGYAGATATDAAIMKDAEVAGVSRTVLASRGPVRFDPDSDHTVPVAIEQRFGVKSMIVVAVYPKMDRPYLFGLHQCSYRRAWTLQEDRLFHEIGRRLADALDTTLMFRNLLDSERELKRSRAELTASRARIVSAADQTRRQIERDLHDGVQQQLVSLVLAQRMAVAVVPPELFEVQAKMSEVVDGLEAVLSELQEISRGIHPAILAQGGLALALRALARRSVVPVDLAVRVPTRLPERVEVAAYYVVSEALNNTAKHARASVAHVAVETHDGVLQLSVRDDGRGGADPANGSGLIGLTDRVDALGGTIDVTSPAGQGTTLRVTLPFEAS